MNRAWIYVGLTSLAELVWIYGFNAASTWWHWLLIIAFLMLDLHFLAKACETLPTGTVYAIFAATGTIGTALMDVFLFGQKLGAGKIGFIALIIVGVIGLKLTDDKTEEADAQSAETERGAV